MELDIKIEESFRETPLGAYLSRSLDDPGKDHSVYRERLEVYRMGFRAGYKPNWISVEKDLPPSQKSVLAIYKNKYGKKSIVKAEYIPPFTVDAQDFFEDWDEGNCDYSDAEDKYYVKSSWYERVENWDYMSCEIIEGEVIKWMELPGIPED